LIAQVGDQKDFESFAFYLDDQLQTQLEHELLSQLAREQAYTRTAVRSAKSGLRRGIVAPESAYPLMDLPADARKAGRPEPAVVLSITRQETEFDPRAISSAGARGLMQLMPATAKSTARIEGLPYEPRWLIEDPAYNVTLGAAHLEHLLEQWNGSYILTFAAYNAGPGNARRWIEENGDPRSSSVDAVDWVEMITFEETRNYVQRVLENVGVYRWRLANTPTPIRIEQDLRRGSF
jgi:soluble lytic murein transglycosylase